MSLAILIKYTNVTDRQTDRHQTTVSTVHTAADCKNLIQQQSYAERDNWNKWHNRHT